MNAPEKSRDELLNEVAVLRQRIRELHAFQKQCHAQCMFGNVWNEETQTHTPLCFDLLAKNTKDVIWTADWNLKWTYISPAMDELRGFTAAETMAQGIDEILTPESAAGARKILGDTLAEAAKDPAVLNQTRNFEAEYYCKGGGTVWTEVRASFLRDDAGNPIGVIGITRDISDRKRSEQALMLSEQRYRHLTETTTDWVWQIDANAVYTYSSPKVLGLLGYAPDEILGKTPFDFMSPDEATRMAEAFSTLVENHLPIAALENTNLHKDGHIVYLETSGVPLFDVHGKFLGYQGCDRDITDRKLAEIRLRNYADEMVSTNQRLALLYSASEEATRAKSEFLANMSHEIRTPMTAILGYTDILRETLTRPEDRDIAETIQRNAEYLLSLVNDILDLSKIEAGRLLIEPVDCPLGPILHEMLAIMRTRAKARGLTLDIDFSGPIPETIRTDPIRLCQILLNLIGNAIKFTEIGGVRVLIHLCEGDNERAMLQVDVIDTGIGITPDQMPRIFRPFSQGDPSTTRRFGGTGLGLSISKRLAALLGGDIDVQSVPNQGSTFRLTTDVGPWQQIRTIAPPNLDATPTESRRESSGLDVCLPCRLLLAEDGPDNQRLIMLLLKKAGAEVVLAENGLVAIHLVQTAKHAGQEYDAILMDMQMPVMDGYVATQKLRDAGFDAPIIALTAHAMAGDREKCLSIGCTDYVSKPIDRASLLRTVARHVKKKSCSL